jgi:hypothetical protein
MVSIKPKTRKLVYVASLLITQHEGERAKTGWLGIGTMCQSAVTCLPTKCLFTQMICHFKNLTKRDDLVQSGHHHFIEFNLFLP